MQQWSIGVQRELFPRASLEINYIGTHGSNLLMRRNIAQAFPYDATNPQSVNARKPFPNFGTYIDSDWSGWSDYHALNTKLEHRAASSILTFAYTWAKSTDSKSAAAGIGASGFNGWQGFLNNHDPERDHGLSDFDVDHRLVGSFVYNLPFGSGEKFAGDATGVKNAVIGGWQVNGIYTWQRGFPLTITAADLGGLNDTFGTNRADLAGEPEQRRADGDPLVQHGGVRAARGRRTRQSRPKHRTRSRREQSGSRAVQDVLGRRAASGCSSGWSRSTRSTIRSSRRSRRTSRRPISAS